VPIFLRFLKCISILKQHKANVRRNKSELREELKQELYRIKRQGGFSSGYKDFQGMVSQFNGIFYSKRLQVCLITDGGSPTSISKMFRPDHVRVYFNFI